MAFHNPTGRNIDFGTRINNLPSPGVRFGQENLTTLIGQNRITRSAQVNNMFLLKDRKVPFMEKLSALEWDGEAVSAQANAGNLSDRVTLIPDQGFAGIYCWNSPEKPMQTIELLTQVISLAGGQTVEFRYMVKLD